jgi:hypothetical protein
VRLDGKMVNIRFLPEQSFNRQLFTRQLFTRQHGPHQRWPQWTTCYPEIQVRESPELLLTKNVLAESCLSGYYPNTPGTNDQKSWSQHEYRRNNQDLSTAEGHVTG